MSEQVAEKTDEQTNDLAEQDVEVTEAEAKARDMGWKPESDWTGDTSKHLSAEQFIDRQEFLKSKAEGITKADNARLEREVSELKKTIADLGSHMKKADQRALERARKEYQAQMDEAVEEGDTAAYNKAKQGIAALDEEVQEAVKETKTSTATSADDDPNFIAWHENNKWYGKGGHLKATIYANNVAKEVAAMGFQGREFYDNIGELVKDEFPDLFQSDNANRKKPQAVEGASTGGGKGKTLWDKVDKEGRDAFARFVKQGIFEDTKEDRAKYAEDYVEE